MPIQLAPALTQQDRDSVHAFYLAHFPDVHPTKLGPRSASLDAQLRDEMRTLTGAEVAPVATHLAAWDGSELVGALTSEIDLPSIAALAAKQVRTTDADGLIKTLVRRTRILSLIAVADSHRNTGLASLLIDEMERVDEGNGVVRWCGVATSEPAIKLVQRRGFLVHQQRSDDGLPLRMCWIEYAVPVANAHGGVGFHKHVGPSAPMQLHPITGRQL